MKFEENDIAITLPKYQNSFIYFLLKDDEVVYVGQTSNGIVRPLSHRNKDFDTIKIIYCDILELDLLEDKYIVKYRPRYNKTLNHAMRYSMMTARNKIRKIFNNNITITDLKKIIRLLDIELVEFNGVLNIKREDYEQVVRHLKEKEGVE